LEGAGLRINFRNTADTPAALLPPLPSSGTNPIFPPIQPGSVILSGLLKKVNLSHDHVDVKHDSGLQESKQNASVFEGLPTMKSRHVELSIAADGNFIHADNILFQVQTILLILSI
jgi:hypothetical protein